MTRVGKIARLPQAVRRSLNQRLANGEKGTTLVAWLNGLPEVWLVLMCDFGGRPITEQNLSEWKQGGFAEWQRHQEALEGLRIAAEQARELAEEAGVTPLTDVLSASVTLLLMRLIRELSEAGTSTPESRRELQGLIRQWTMLRRADQRAARLKMQQSDWATARAREAEEAAREAAAAERAEAEAMVEAVAPRKRAPATLEQMAGFDSRRKAAGWRVVREKMEGVQRDSMLDILCSGLGRERAAVLREAVENEAVDRELEVLDEVERALGNPCAASEADTAVEEEKEEEGDVWAEAETEEGEAAPNPGESDLIRVEKKVGGASLPLGVEERSSEGQGCPSHFPQAAATAKGGVT